MKIFKIISSIIVMFFLVTFIPQEYRADEKVKLNVTYGIDGKFKGKKGVKRAVLRKFSLKRS